MKPLSSLSASQILDSLGDGVYVTNVDREIIYWSATAEHITGWPKDEVVGRACHENVLCHIDKDGNRLCGKESCPLHRAIVTGERSTLPIIVYANGKDGNRIPMQVTVAPIKDEEGKIVGGVESFRDLRRLMQDLERAQRVQARAVHRELPTHPRFQLAAHYVSSDVIGGDYIAAEKLADDTIAILVADVMGHGVAAALYTMCIHSIWEEWRGELHDPGSFIQHLNNSLNKVTGTGEYFATAVFFNFDPESGQLLWAGAGHPNPLVLSPDEAILELDAAGLPLGMLPDIRVETKSHVLKQGSKLLAYTDGAVEVFNADQEELGTEGLKKWLLDMDYIKSPPRHRYLHERLLQYSNDIRLPDDVSILELIYR